MRDRRVHSSSFWRGLKFILDAYFFVCGHEHGKSIHCPVVWIHPYIIERFSKLIRQAFMYRIVLPFRIHQEYIEQFFKDSHADSSDKRIDIPTHWMQMSTEIQNSFKLQKCLVLLESHTRAELASRLRQNFIVFHRLYTSPSDNDGLNICASLSHIKHLIASIIARRIIYSAAMTESYFAPSRMAEIYFL